MCDLTTLTAKSSFPGYIYRFSPLHVNIAVVCPKCSGACGGETTDGGAASAEIREFMIQADLESAKREVQELRHELDKEKTKVADLKSKDQENK